MICVWSLSGKEGWQEGEKTRCGMTYQLDELLDMLFLFALEGTIDSDLTLRLYLASLIVYAVSEP